LSLEDIVNFSQVSSCGTSTAVSVPCMLSVFTKDTYSYKKELRTQNIMDILHRANINILWRDNNSNWQELLENGTYEDFKNPKINTVCDIECRDEGMLKGLDEYIDNTDQDIFIVLHQMGNHGPAYYKRYPKKFEKFKPVCTSKQLEQCTKQSISNAYDNAIVYTDYFLSKVIKFLKKKDNQNIQTAMIYLSDHGESLGEGGVYLHGLPYFMAPKNQTHVPMIMWFSNSFKQIINIDKIKKNSNKQYSQDNLFHTILSIMQIKTSIYDKNMDMLDTK
jgi:lipid A ethanolaminephosphotransferase